MATIKVGNAMPEWGWFEDFYDEGSLKLKTKTDTKAVYEDKNGATIVLTGTGFDYQGGAIVGGVVKSVEFDDDKGGTLISVTDGHYQADKLTGSLEKNASVYNFMSQLTAGDDKVIGNDIGDNLNFGEDRGNDTIIAGAGGSFVGGAQGNDTLKGGIGWDTLSYEETYYRGDDTKGIVLDATKGTVKDSWGDTDRISGFEEYRGSEHDDVMKGSKNDEYFAGLRGDDKIDGGKGEDAVEYFKDLKFGGKHGIVADLGKGTVIDSFGDKDHVSDIERVYGTYKSDKFVGDAGDNLFRGISGADSYDGGKGTDAVDFSWWEELGQHGVTVDLTKSKNQIADDGFNNTESVKNIEAVSGSAFNDRIRLADGGWGWGFDGDDKITDGTGRQWLGGGTGADTFIFAGVKTMNAGKDIDYIDDFSQSDGDRIDLSGIKGLSFEGTGEFAGGKEVRYVIDDGHTYVSGDADGDKQADFRIDLNGEITLTNDDFIL